MTLSAPFPYFGGKSKAADLIWSRFGTGLGNYAEPFFGSGAVWLNRPASFEGWAVINDLNGHVANFWRATKAAPDEVAAFADAPVHECDLHARHLWLVKTSAALTARLMADPDHYDVKAAGWWCWGACSWIGGGWCAGDGPWHAAPDAEGIPTFTLGKGGKGVKRQLPHIGDSGQGVNRKLPHIGDGQGVNRKLPHIGDSGRGVNRKLPHIGDGGQGVNRIGAQSSALSDWFARLSQSLREARFACGDWERICSVGTLTRNGPCAVLLDPPYSQTAAVYASDSSTVAHDVRAWCVEHGGNPLLRIALCGHDSEHNALEALGWTVETWAKSGGYQGADTRERIWFSPHCAEANQKELF